MLIGFSINEGLFLATLATGACWVAWRLRLRRLGSVPAKKPWWVHFGAELFVVVALMFTCRVAVADWPKVPTGSMEPTLRVGDYLLVNHFAYGPRLPFTNTAIELGQPQRGDVVVFRFPPDVSQFYVKRLVGLPGDVVRFENGVVSLGDAPAQVQLLGEGVEPGTRRRRPRPVAAARDARRPQPRDQGQPLRAGPHAAGGSGRRTAACSAPAAWRCVVPAGPLPDARRQPRQLDGLARSGASCRTSRSTARRCACSSTSPTGRAHGHPCDPERRRSPAATSCSACPAASPATRRPS